MKKKIYKALIAFNVAILLSGLIMYYKSFNLIAFYMETSPTIKQTMVSEYGGVEYNADMVACGVDITTTRYNGEELQRLHIPNYDSLIMFLSLIINVSVLILYKKEDKETNIEND